MDKKYCECGCGQKIKGKNRFILGHNNRGKKLNLTEEQIKRKQEIIKNNWKTPNIRSSMISGIKKAKNTTKGKKDNSNAAKVTAKIIREKLKNDPIYKEEKRKQSSKAAKKLWATRREDMLEIRKNQWTEKSRNKMSITTKKRLEDPDERRKQKERAIKRFSDPKVREKQSKIISEAYINGKLSLDHKHYKTGYIETSAGKIFYQSSYEKRFIYILEYFFKDQWKRCPIKFPYFDGEINRNYIPDFLINDKFFIEVKGWFDDKDRNKVIKATKSSNFSIYLIFEKQLIFLESLMNLSKTFPFKKLPKIQNGIEYLK